jgi:hypothetical protein
MGEPGLFDGGMMHESMAAHHRPVNSGHAREALPAAPLIRRLAGHDGDGMTTEDITDKINAVIGARNDPVLAGSDTAAVAPPRRGGFALSVRSVLPRPCELKRAVTATGTFRQRQEETNNGTY